MTTVSLPSRSARADLAALTQARIMQGVADILVAGEEFTFRLLAEVSAVPERTIYRHFATREAVFSAFWAWINDRLDMPPPPGSAAELIDQVPKLFSAFEAGEAVVRAMLHDPHGRETRLANAETRRTRMRTALAETLAALAPSEGKRLLAVVQLLSSAAAWESMKDQWGMTATEAADAAQWAIATLIAGPGSSSRPSARRGPAAKRDGAPPSRKGRG